MPHLFDEFRLREISFRNRIGVSPMCQYSSREGLDNLAFPLRTLQELAHARSQPVCHLAAVRQGFLAQPALKSRPLRVGVGEGMAAT
jgi:2,4-dienoyl-CoA reductase-like NADH-dependent reductase (Old Yellow Enzyme family)